MQVYHHNHKNQNIYRHENNILSFGPVHIIHTQLTDVIINYYLISNRVS